MITENVSTLKLNRLTNEQYKRELAAGNINEDELYLTPDDTYSKAEINSLLPSYGIGNVSLESDGDDSDRWYSIQNNELASLAFDTNEHIVFVMPNSKIYNPISNGNTYIMFCHSDLVLKKNKLQWLVNGVWTDVNLGDAKQIQNCQCMILAVKGDGATMAPKFEYVRWLNP